jgi:hypothetical protein
VQKSRDAIKRWQRGTKRPVLEGQWVAQEVEQEFLELNDFYPDAAPRFPPSVRVEG